MDSARPPDKWSRQYGVPARDLMEWETVEQVPAIGVREVHLWLFNLDVSAAVLDRLRSTLSAQELERAGRLRFAGGPERLVARRGTMRQILGSYLGLAGGSLSFETNEFGKPFLSPSAHSTDIQFNLSHDRQWALLGITRRRAIGVDIELARENVARDRIPEHFFAPAEVAKLRALPVKQQTQGFFSCWTRKEAYIKARGRGLSLPLDSFEVSLAPDQPAALLVTHDDPAEAQRWTLTALPAPDGFSAAMCVQGQASTARCFRLGSQDEAYHNQESAQENE